MRFSLLVIGDTQYLFDGDRQRPDLLDATLQRAGRLARGLRAPLAHVIHVGDVTEHGRVQECASALEVLAAGCRSLGVAATVVTGNHDIDETTTDERGSTPFLTAFGARGALARALEPQQPRSLLVAPGGYCAYREVSAPGGDPALGVLALDWRPGAPTWRWAEQVLVERCGPGGTPTILVSHDAALHLRDDSGRPIGPGDLTDHGRRLVDLLHRAGAHSVMLVLAGHEWPSARVTVDGPGGAPLEVHVVNYQDLPYGGAGAARLYVLDTCRGRCDVVSFTAGLDDPAVLASAAARRSLSLGREEDQFSFPLPAALGGRHEPWQAEGLTKVLDLSDTGDEGLSGTFELELPARFVIEVRARLPEAMPAAWQVLLARLAAGGRAPDGSSEPLAALSLSSEAFAGWNAYLASDVPGGWCETWQTSHELVPGSTVTLVLAGGSGEHGLWVDGDAVGRDDRNASGPLLPGPWRWRLGAGEWDGEPADGFGGAVLSVRAWS